jgi:hypothetical protein
MTQQDLLAQITPFKPFRVITTSGDTYDVWHREAYILTPSYLMIGLLPTPTGQTYERSVTLDIFHVVGVEPLPVSAKPPQGNGQAGQST